MAAEWIKMRLNLGDDPAVIFIATETGLDQDAVVGKLHRLWAWVSEHCTDGSLTHVRSVFVDHLLRTPGFADAMKKAGWLEETSNGILIPKFDRHMSESAKKRALNAIQVARHRENRKPIVSLNELHLADETNTRSYSYSHSYSDSNSSNLEGGAGETFTPEAETPTGFLPMSAAIESDNRYINAGQRPLEKYPEIWLSPAELPRVLELATEAGLKDKVSLFETVQAKLKSKPSHERPAVNAYLWLTGWALREALQNKKSSLDAKRAALYLANATRGD